VHRTHRSPPRRLRRGPHGSQPAPVRQPQAGTSTRRPGVRPHRCSPSPIVLPPLPSGLPRSECSFVAVIIRRRRVCVRTCVRVHACVRACARACMRACVEGEVRSDESTHLEHEGAHVREQAGGVSRVLVSAHGEFLVTLFHAFLPASDTACSPRQSARTHTSSRTGTRTRIHERAGGEICVRTHAPCARRHAHCTGSAQPDRDAHRLQFGHCRPAPLHSLPDDGSGCDAALAGTTTDAYGRVRTACICRPRRRGRACMSSPHSRALSHVDEEPRITRWCTCREWPRMECHGAFGLGAWHPAGSQRVARPGTTFRCLRATVRCKQGAVGGRRSAGSMHERAGRCLAPRLHDAELTLGVLVLEVVVPSRTRFMPTAVHFRSCCM
jgi:hypothetical protein